MPRSFKFLALILCTVALAGVVVYFVVSAGGDPPAKVVASPSSTCGPAVTRPPTPTGECVGPVTDSALLDPALRPAADKILKANREVAAGQAAYVTVVLLSPLSVSRNSNSAMSLNMVRFSLEGAYTALHRANTTPVFGDPNAPAIQLLLFNFGSRQEFDQNLAADVLALGQGEHPVVAVVGLGSSFTGTEQIADALAQRGVPMVSAVTSATSLNAANYPTFHSVSPDNIDYALALKDLIVKHPELPLRHGIVVADQNQDPYVATLNDAFTNVLKDYVVYPPLVFRGSTVDHAATPDVFSPVVANICAVVNNQANPLDTIFFAGRVQDFHTFAKVLVGRCGKPLTVMVGATGFQAAREEEKLLDEGEVTVIYSSSADAPSWIKGSADTPAGFAAFRRAFEATGAEAADLDDGYAVMYHDAMASAAAAIRVAAQGRDVPTPADVNLQFGNLTSAYAVPGASGTLSFAERAKRDGRSSGNAVVYRQIGSGPPRLPAGVKPYVTR